MTATWTDIPDSALEAEHVVTQETMFALRDNVEAFAEGAVGAPTISAKNIGVGGAETDGAAGNATDFTKSGRYHFTGSPAFNVSGNQTFPAFSIIRCKGNLTLSAILDVSQPTIIEKVLASAVGIIVGQPGELHSGSAGDGGGGGVGAGGNGGTLGGTGGTGGSATDISAVKNFWSLLAGLIGGLSPTDIGGGVTVIVVEGNADLTGGTIKANGAAASATAKGGGAGGTVIVICTGTLTAGTYEAKGGVGGSGSIGGGGGGGGYVGLIASAFAGSRTKTVTGGAAGSGGTGATAGGNGVAEEITLTAKQIQAMLIN